MEMKLNCSSVFLSTKALIVGLAGVGLLLLLFQLWDSMCPCSPKVLALWPQSIGTTFQQAAPSPSFDKASMIAGKVFSSEKQTASSNSSVPHENEEASDGRHLQPYGVAAHLFVHLASYRGGARTFATVGLASKPLHVFGRPGFGCEWIPEGKFSTDSVMAKGSTLLPDWGFGRVYTVVVVNCTFDADVGTDSEGGHLVVHAYHGDGFGIPARIPALKELPGEYNSSLFHPPYPYKYLYCGSPLYGSINPERMREWMAYHAWIFGPSSFFVLYDAGGVHSAIRKVLDPWIKLGRVKIESVREQKNYDGYYYNQFLFVNDCLHKYRFMADWTFFFDVDEYIYIAPGEAMDSVLQENGASQILINERHISDKLCLTDSDNISAAGDSGNWGFEKLVFKNVKKGRRWNRKYAIQARNAFSAGVHLSQNLVGKTVRSDGNKLRFYHYHDTISYQGELCREYVNLQDVNNVWFERNPYKYDGSMKALAGDVRKYEKKLLGSQSDGLFA